MPSSVYDPLTGTISEGESKWFVPEDRLNPDQKRFLRDVDINQHTTVHENPLTFWQNAIFSTV